MLRKSLSALLFIMCSVSVVRSQETKFALGLHGSPDYYSYHFSELLGTSHFYYRKDFSYSLGVNLLVKNGRVGFSAGIDYSAKNYGIDYKYRAIDPNDPFIPTKIKLQLCYIEFPFLLHVDYLQKEHFTLFASGGIVFSNLHQKKETKFFNDSTVATSEIGQEVNQNITALHIGTGFSYLVIQWLQLRVDPFFRYYLGKLDDANHNDRTLQAGLNVGLQCILFNGK